MNEYIIAYVFLISIKKTGSSDSANRTNNANNANYSDSTVSTEGHAMDYPRIYLAIDNCFASKRWTKPAEWTKVIADLGLFYIEASADTESDPLFMDPAYLEDWIEEVKVHSAINGVRVVNLYSGHGTYSTLGLTHTDVRVRERMQHQWLEPLLLMAEKLEAGVGFYCHAFNDSVLQNKREYREMERDLFDRLKDLALLAKEHGQLIIGVEQMYSPHQIPWTIKGTRTLLEDVYSQGGNPFYVTIDTGHQTGQDKFRRPTTVEIRSVLMGTDDSVKDTDMIWLGPQVCYELLEKFKIGQIDLEACLSEMNQEMDKFSHLFSNIGDGNTYNWLEKFGCYSPIIHLQQTDGKSSSHMPFTAKANSMGKISGEQLLNALAVSYQQAADARMPEKCRDIYLTLEMFSSTASINYNTLKDLKESVAYWRQFIPEDGLTLDQLMALPIMKKDI